MAPIPYPILDTANGANSLESLLKSRRRQVGQKHIIENGAVKKFTGSVCGS